jgi:hypothetical protein
MAIVTVHMGRSAADTAMEHPMVALGPDHAAAVLELASVALEQAVVAFKAAKVL